MSSPASRGSSRSRSPSGSRSRSGSRSSRDARSSSRSKSRSRSPVAGDHDAPTQALTQDDSNDRPTQAFAQGYSPTQALDSQDYVPTQKFAEDVDETAATQPFNNGDVEERKSVHESDDDEGKKSRSVSRSRSRSKSRSVSGSRSRSRSKSGSKANSRSRSVSRSKSGSRSRSVSMSRSKSRSRSKSGSGSRSRSRSSRRGGSGSDSDDGKSKSTAVKEATGGEADKEKAAALPDMSDSDDSRPTSRAENVAKSEPPSKPKRPASDSDSDDDIRRNPSPGPGGDDNRDSRGRLMSDFDMMMEKKRSEQRKKRKKKDIDLINDNDDAIARLIADMRVAAREDRDLNEARAPAIKKIAMMPNVMAQLRKADLQMAFVEANVLSVMTDWLAPMPDKSLPSLKIRQELLKLLLNLRIDDQSRLKESGIGKAVMYLYKHPKEHRSNKELAGKIVANWSRPIFNKSSDYKDFDREDRKRRDQTMGYVGGKNAKEVEPEESEEGLRPGDPGWVGRARVPMPSGRDYVKRPAWQTDADLSKSNRKKEMSKLDRHMRNFADGKRMAMSNRKAVDMSLEGRKMSL